MALLLLETILKGSPASIRGWDNLLLSSATRLLNLRVFGVARLDNQQWGTSLWETLSAWMLYD
jgi:hypothetical protein